jgi:hypothetical protein
MQSIGVMMAEVPAFHGVVTLPIMPPLSLEAERQKSCATTAACCALPKPYLLMATQKLIKRL